MTTGMSGENNRNEIQQKLNSAYDYEVEGKPVEALQLCAKIIQIDPDFAEVYNLQGIILEQLGQKQEALRAYNRAMTLDPDFEEASENFAGLRAELEPYNSGEDIVYVEGRDPNKKDAIYVAKWGALAFGLCFGILEIIRTVEFYLDTYLIESQIFWNSGTQIQFSLFLSVVFPILGVGLATAVLGNVSQKRTFVFGVVGGFGFIVSGWLQWTLFEALTQVPEYLSSFTIFFISSISATIAGIVFGGALGLPTRDKRQVGWLALAGAGGFFIQDLVFRFFRVTMLENSLFVFDSYSEPSLVAYLIPGLIVSVFTGGLIGAMLGGVLGWFSDEKIVDEDNSELIEQTIPLN